MTSGEFKTFFKIDSFPSPKQRQGIAKTKQGKLQFYERGDVVSDYMLKLLLSRNKPKIPFAPGTPLEVEFVLLYAVKDKRLWGQPKVTRPDADNSLKKLQDYMTQKRYWGDDSQIYHLTVSKYYWEYNAIEISIKESHRIYTRTEEESSETKSNSKNAFRYKKF